MPALVYGAGLVFGRGYVLGWQRADSVTFAQAAPLAAAYLAYLAFVLGVVVGPLGERLPRAWLWAGLLAGSVMLQVAATAVVEPYPLRGIVFRQLSQESSGYFSIGARWEDLGDVLAHYTQYAPDWPIHPRNQPPGLMLIFWAATRFAELLGPAAVSIADVFRPLTCFDEGSVALTDAQIAGGALGTVFEFVAATLAVIPLWGLIRKLAGERAAWLAAALYPMTASMLAWVSRWDRVFVYVTICGVWLIESLLGALQAGQRRRGLSLAAALGGLVAAGLFLSYKLAPALLTLGLYFLARAVQLQRASGRPLNRGWLKETASAIVVAATVCIGLWAAFILVTGFDLVTHFRESVGFHSGMDRPYYPWAVFSALDIVNHIGLPFAMMALLFGPRRYAPLWLAVFGTIFTLSVFRITHDETGRLMMYLAPLAIGLAAITLAGRPRRTVAAVTVLAVGQLFLHLLLLRVISYGVDPLTVAPAPLPADMISTSIRFGKEGELRLLGYTLPETLSPGQSSEVVYYWRLEAGAPIQKSYKVFLHVSQTLDDQDRIVSADGKPMNWTYPTSCWQPGQIIRDPHGFEVSASARAGPWLALVGLYDERTGARAHVFEAQRARGGAVELPGKLVIR